MSALDQPWLHDLVATLSAPTVVLSESSGQIRDRDAQGVLHADVRVLSEAVLTVGGVEPEAISGGITGARTARFTSVARGLGDAATVDPTVRVDRERTVGAGEVSERLRLASFADAPVDTELTVTVAADLAGLRDIKTRGSAPPVPLRVSFAGDTILSWGNDAVRVTLAAPGASVALSADQTAAVLRWSVRLDGRGSREVSWRLAVADEAAAVAPATSPPWRVSATADDPRLPALLSQSLADADALKMTMPAADDVFLAAGAPWFFTLFGRDSIWAARLLLPFGWQLAAGTLRTLAGFQGTEVNPQTAEAPGKIPHELRRQGYLHYDSIDATPLWVCLLHDAWRWGMPDDEIAALLPNLTAALDFMKHYGDSDGDGLLEYIDASGGHGLANQGWKDSGDAIRFADGRIATPPVALCEVQGYAHEAAIHGADLLEHFGAPGGQQWRAWAARLATVFRESFWVNGYPALALDASKRPVDSLTSNIGHLLGTGMLTPDEEALVAESLSGDDMNSGFGVRTMSAQNSGYNPLSYHCGSVWSHDTAIVLSRLFRSGHPKEAAALADGLLAAAAGFGWRLPELFAGDAGPWPTPYPAACRPQAWSAAAAGALVQGILGLDVNVPAGTVAVRAPGVRVGGAGFRLHVDGLVAGTETFSAGITESGDPYVGGCSLTRVPGAAALEATASAEDSLEHARVAADLKA